MIGYGGYDDSSPNTNKDRSVSKVIGYSGYDDDSARGKKGGFFFMEELFNIFTFKRLVLKCGN